MGDEERQEGSLQESQETQETQENEGQEEGRQKPPHNPDKAIQKLQMEHAATKRTLGQVLQGMNELKESLKSQGSPKAQKDAQAVQTAIDDLSDDETVDGRTLREALKGVSKTVKEELGEILSDFRETKRSTEVDRFWREWEKKHPEVASEKDEILFEAENEVDSTYPHLTDQERGVAVQLLFDRLVKDRESKKKGKAKGKGSQGSNPRVTPPGGGSSSPTNDPDREPGPLWVPSGE